MNKLGVSGAGIGANGNARGRPMAAGAARAAAAPVDVPPNLDTGVLFVGDGGAPMSPGARHDAFAPLTDMVGPRMGPANPAWGNDALALLRSLQKRLIAHALTRDAGERRRCLDAIAVLEPAVGMRLRIMQMQMSELENDHGK
jgi:hypothetical protein